MILAGDEFLRSQHGNNNAFCQDNELSWVDWRLPDRDCRMLRFTRELIALRKRHACLRHRRFLTGRPSNGQTHPDVAWHGECLNAPEFGDAEGRLLAFTLAGRSPGEPMLNVVFNMGDVARVVALPVLEEKRQWRRIVDTAAAPPRDIVSRADDANVESGACTVQPRSVVVLEEG
jgi:glycogen operon protein